MQCFQGKSVYKGIAMGPIVVLKKNDYQVKRTRIEDTEAEVKRVKEAVEVSKKQLGRLYDKAVREVGEASAAIFEVHQMMLEDEDYLEAIQNMIRTEQVNAEYAVAVTGDNFAQMFAAMEDEKGGLLVANRGLYEYEILEEQDNAIAVTLLRCVAEMGDWGYFPTPKAQQLGTFCLEFEVVPYAAGETGTAFEEGYAFQQDLTVAQAGLERAFLRKPGQVKPELIEGKLPLEMSFLAFEGNGIHMTAFKKGQKKDDLFVRFVNHMEQGEILSFKKEDWMKEVYRSNVIEEKNDVLTPDADGIYHVSLREFEIATFGVVR